MDLRVYHPLLFVLPHQKSDTEKQLEGWRSKSESEKQEKVLVQAKKYVKDVLKAEWILMDFFLRGNIFSWLAILVFNLTSWNFTFSSLILIEFLCLFNYKVWSAWGVGKEWNFLHKLYHNSIKYVKSLEWFIVHVRDKLINFPHEWALEKSLNFPLRRELLFTGKIAVKSCFSNCGRLLKL